MMLIVSVQHGLVFKHLKSSVNFPLRMPRDKTSSLALRKTLCCAREFLVIKYLLSFHLG